MAKLTHGSDEGPSLDGFRDLGVDREDDHDLERVDAEEDPLAEEARPPETVLQKLKLEEHTKSVFLNKILRLATKSCR